jgi:very-short-patch-repair endonuclease
MHADGPIPATPLPRSDRRFVHRRIAEIAEAQHGLITTTQLAGLGVVDRTARAWAADGRLHRVQTGIYAVGHRPLTPHARWLAGVLACTEGSVLSHRSCAALARFRRDWAGGVDVTVPGRIGKSREGLVVHRADLLLSREITEVAGIPCTTVARTLVDLATVLRPDQVEYTIHTAQSKRLVTRAEIAAVIAHLPGRRGTGVVRRILRLTDESEDDARSSNERRFRRIIRRARLPAPVGNYWVALASHPAGGVEVDFAWPSRRVAVEIDSAVYHETERARINDPARTRALMLAGWRVIRFSDRDLLERPAQVAAQMRRLI